MSASEPPIARAEGDPDGESRSARARERQSRREQAATPETRGQSSLTPAGNMLPERPRRRFGLERLMVRLVATGGVIGIGVLIAAILAASKVQGWIIGLVVAIVSVVLSAVLWSSRQL